MTDVLDRSSFSVRRVGPLDVDMLGEQRELLEDLRAGMTADSDTAGATLDAVDGMVHLCGYLTDCYEYAVQEAARPAHERGRIALSRAIDGLLELTSILEDADADHDAGEGSSADLSWELPALESVIAAMTSAVIDERPPEVLVCFPELAPIA